MLGGDAQDRAKLRGQHLWAAQRQADAAHAQEGVLLRRHGQRRKRFVGAGVKRAHDQRASAQGTGDLTQRMGLLVLARELVATQKEELGAQQADALRPQLHRARGV